MLSLVAEMRDEVEGLRTLRDSEEETFCRNCTLPHPTQMHPPHTSQEAMVVHPLTTRQNGTLEMEGRE